VDGKVSSNCRAMPIGRGLENQGRVALRTVLSDKPARKVSLPKPYGDDGS
jgi:hypothetical protein